MEELTGQQSEHLRRLLADARHTEPMPPDVAARLDAVIADLGSGARRESTVVPLAERRRRAGWLVMAAAAVVAAGVGVGQLVGAGGGPESGTSGAADSALSAPDRESAEADTPPADGDPGTGAVVRSQRSLADVRPVTIRTDHFARDARRARAVAVSAARDPAPEGSPTRGRDAAGCEPGVWGGGHYVAARYGGMSGWLVVRPPRGDTQVVDLFVCGEDSAERSTTLRFR